MAKRERVDIDEDAIKRVMAGDISGISHSVTVGTLPAIEENNAQKEVKSPDKQPNIRLRKRNELTDYSLFLKKRDSSSKRQTYISGSLYSKLTEILAVISKEISVPTYIDNVLTDHLEQYKDDINELYEKKIKKPL